MYKVNSLVPRLEFCVCGKSGYEASLHVVWERDHLCRRARRGLYPDYPRSAQLAGSLGTRLVSISFPDLIVTFLVGLVQLLDDPHTAMDEEGSVGGHWLRDKANSVMDRLDGEPDVLFGVHLARETGPFPAHTTLL